MQLVLVQAKIFRLSEESREAKRRASAGGNTGEHEQYKMAAVRFRCEVGKFYLHGLEVRKMVTESNTVKLCPVLHRAIVISEYNP